MRDMIRLRKSADFAITADFLNSYGGIVADASELVFTLPSPQAIYNRLDCEISNYASGWCSVVCNDGFVDTSDVVLLAPGETRKFACIKMALPSVYKWVKEGMQDAPPKWAAYTPTNTFTTATPVLSAYSYKYQLTPKGLCHVEIHMAGTDGAGATALTITPPPGCYPLNYDIDAALGAELIVDGVKTSPGCYIDCKDADPANRIIGFRLFSTLTDDKAWELNIKGVFPVWGGALYTTTGVFTTATPTSSDLDAVYAVEGGLCYAWIYQVFSDGKGCTAITYTPPMPVKDVNVYNAGVGFDLVDATYDDAMPYVDATHDTATSRLIGFKSLPTLTDGKGAAITLAVQFEVDGGFAYDPTEVWEVAPASWAGSMRYHIDRDARVFSFEYSGTSADGNANTTLEIPLPVVPKYDADAKTILYGYQLVDSTASFPAPYVDRSVVAGRTRAKILFDNLSPMTDAKTSTIYAAGQLPID